MSSDESVVSETKDHGAPPQPIFILGAVRSGTTLLRYGIDSHPRIAVPCEWNFTQGIVQAFEVFMHVFHDNEGELREEHGKRELGIDHDFQEIAERLRSWFETWYLDYARRHGKARWGANTHSVLDRYVREVDHLFDGDPQYVIIVRHPLDQVVSSIEKFQRTPSFSIDSVRERLRRWTGVARHHLDVETEISERCIRVHYENVVRNPGDTFDEIFRFLGEDPVPDIENRMFEVSHDGEVSDHKIRQTSRIHESSLGRWKDVLDISTVDRALEELPDTVELMHRLGYGLNEV